MQNVVDKEKDLTAEAHRIEGDIPNGGYGYVVVGCLVATNAVTWGQATSYGVYQSFFLANNYYDGGTPIKYAFVAGLFISLALFLAPLANFISRKYHFKICLVAGTLLTSLGLIFAGLSHTIWQLFLTQGVMFGLGIGLIFIPTLPLISQWFSTKRALANGIAACGTGLGGVILSNTTRILIERVSLKWAYIINGLISLAVLTPCVILIKSRSKLIDAKFETLKWSYFFHPGLIYVWVWAFLCQIGYFIGLYSNSTFATQGLGLSQTKGAALQSILSAGQMVGRPIIGLSLDKFGRINVTMIVTLLSGFTCLFIWMFARSFGVLIFYAFLAGIFQGVFWGTISPVLAEVVGVQELGSALAVCWLVVTLPSLFGDVIALGLDDYVRNQKHKAGADVFLPSIGVGGGAFILASVALLGTRAHVMKQKGQPFRVLYVSVTRTTFFGRALQG